MKVLSQADQPGFGTRQARFGDLCAGSWAGPSRSADESTPSVHPGMRRRSMSQSLSVPSSHGCVASLRSREDPRRFGNSAALLREH